MRSRYTINGFNQRSHLLDELWARLRATPMDRLSVQYREFMEWVEMEVMRWLTRDAKKQLEAWLDMGDVESPPWTPLAAAIPHANLLSFIDVETSRLRPEDRSKFVSDFIADAKFNMFEFAKRDVFIAKYPARPAGAASGAADAAAGGAADAGGAAIAVAAAAAATPAAPVNK